MSVCGIAVSCRLFNFTDDLMYVTYVCRKGLMVGCLSTLVLFTNSLRALSLSQVEEMFEAETLAVRAEGEQEETTRESVRKSSRKIKDRLKVCMLWYMDALSSISCLVSQVHGIAIERVFLLSHRQVPAVCAALHHNV